MATRVWALVSLLLAASSFGSTAVAAELCEDIAAEIQLIGEMRYETRADTDEYWVNNYWGEYDADYLYLGEYQIIGGATVGANLGFSSFINHEDGTGSDCTTVTFNVKLERSNTPAGEGSVCPGGVLTSNTYTTTMNTCAGANADLLWASKILGGWFLSHKYYWRATLWIDSGNGVLKTETGCFEVLTSNECTLIDF